MKNFFKRYSYRLLAWAIFILSLFFFYHRFYSLSHKIDRNFVVALIQNIDILIVLWVFVFVFVNWGIEALKWKIVNKPIESIRFLQSYKAVLMGVAVSNIFPNRTGEFIGKVMVLSKPNRVKGIFSSMLSSLAQLSVTLVMGVGAMFFLTSHYYIPTFYVGASTFIIVLLLVFFKPLVFFLSRFLPEKWCLFLDFVKAYSFKDIGQLIVLSWVRYMVFSFQLYLLFMGLGVGIHLFDFMQYAAFAFLLTTLIPTTSFSELFVRSNVGILIFSELYINDGIIIIAYTLLWIFNILLPSLIGFYLGLMKN